MGILVAGFLAGFLHVLAGPDHLAAVAPYAGSGRGRAWRLGVRWGVGHASGVVIVGVLSLLLREVLPIEALSAASGASAWSERAVGVVLIGIGVWGLRAALRHRLHVHTHDHEEEPRARPHGERARAQPHADAPHAHVHFHAPGVAHADTRAHRHGHAALAVGTLHGLAGSSHLLGVLPAMALPTRAAAGFYLLAFGIGTIAAMAAFSQLVGIVGARVERRGAPVYQGFLGICSIAALGVGCFWLLQG